MHILKPLKITKPTPIERLSGIKGKTVIFIKRDDLNGLLISGNKARKLEYLIADAKKKGCDTIITCGPVQSNHCRTTAAFARIFGLECHLFLRRRGDEEITGNLLLDKLLGAKITFITPEEYQRRMEIMEDYAMRLKKRKPYIIPEGGSNEIGALGYVDCIKEMADFIREKRIEAIYCAVGSGGTYAGLLLGKKLLGIEVDLNGVIICDTVEYFRNKIVDILNNARNRFEFKFSIGEKDIILIDGFVGEGYGIPYPEEIETIKSLARNGIILEPVYTGKAFYGMLNDLEKRNYKRVIFIHTGGIFSIFAYNKELG
jgi:D-cysteine desulfhydrase|uniref:D-cysteine desulfhydrase family protein n=1 Tax=candidate division WOR-3 bacterium TaxID=2052148 RepID=A0A7V3RIA4_UNCW3